MNYSKSENRERSARYQKVISLFLLILLIFAIAFRSKPAKASAISFSSLSKVVQNLLTQLRNNINDVRDQTTGGIVSRVPASVDNMKLSGNVIDFNGGGAGNGNVPQINFHQGESMLYDDGNLHIFTDDYLYLNASNTVFVQNSLQVRGQLCLASDCRTTWPTAGSGFDGTGTANSIAKFSGNTTLASSLLYDDGTNIGIGTTSPTYRLSLSGAANSVTAAGLTAINSNETANAGTILRVQSGANNGTKASGFLGAFSNSYTQFPGFTNRVVIASNGSEGTGISFVTGDSSQDFRFLTNGSTERFRIGSDGNIGIGTSTNINSKLTLAADTTAAGGILFGTDTNLYRSAADTLKTDDGLTVTGALGVGAAAPASDKFYITGASNTNSTYALHVYNSDNTELFYVRNDGKARFLPGSSQQFGVDYNFNNSALDPFNTNQFSLSNTDTTLGSHIVTRYQLADGENAYLDVIRPANDSVAVAIGTRTSSQAYTEHLRIIQSGNVGIGSTNPNSKLQVAGPIATAVSNQTSTYSITANDSIVTASASGGAFNTTLPTAVGITGRQYTIKKTDATGNAVTVNTTSSQTIDAATTYALGAQWKYVTVVSDGSNWLIIANN